MVDLETTGIAAGCGILSIGACTFDGSEEFYERISPASSRAEGFVDNMDTLRWWNRQDFRMKEEAFGGTKSVMEVLYAFHDWFRLLDKDHKNIYIWGNGADFDLPILAAYYQKMDRPLPWAPYNGRCFRTLKNLLPHVKPPARVAGKHHALEDAIFQASHARLLLQVL
jgi:exodeoxyribonuclease VIII